METLRSFLVILPVFAILFWLSCIRPKFDHKETNRPTERVRKTKTSFRQKSVNSSESAIERIRRRQNVQYL